MSASRALEAASPAAAPEAAGKQTFAEHLGELRRRLFWSVMCVLAGAVAGYFLRGVIQTALLAPLDQPLYYSSPTGGFDFLFKICIFFGLVASVPVLTYNLLKFFEPALPRKISKGLIKIMFFSTSLTVLGAAFAYFVSLPAALHFLAGFSQGDIHSLISTDAYFSFVMVYIAGFAILFQMPLLMLAFNKINPMGPGDIMKKQRLVILTSFLVAAVLTPTPDPLNQTIMAVPIILLYQISGILVWLANRRLQRKARRAAPATAIQRQPKLRWQQQLAEAGQVARQIKAAPAVVAITQSAQPPAPAAPEPSPAQSIPRQAPAYQMARTIDLSAHRPKPNRDYSRLHNVVDLRASGGQAA